MEAYLNHETEYGWYLCLDKERNCLQQSFQWVVLRDAEKIVPVGFPQVKSYAVYVQSIDIGSTSYGDITRYFAEHGILFNGRELIRPTLAQMLRNPVWLKKISEKSDLLKNPNPQRGEEMRERQIGI